MNILLLLRPVSLQLAERLTGLERCNYLPESLMDILS